MSETMWTPQIGQHVRIKQHGISANNDLFDAERAEAERVHWEGVIIQYYDWGWHPNCWKVEFGTTDCWFTADELEPLPDPREAELARLQRQFDLALGALEHLREDALAERNEYRLLQIDYALKNIEAMGKETAE